MAGENEAPDLSAMSDEDFLKLDPSEYATTPAGDDDDTLTPEQIEEQRRADLTEEERAAEDAAGDDGKGSDDKGKGGEGDDPTPEELAAQAETDRRAALTPEERAAEDADAGDAAEEEKTRRAALTQEERDAEDAEADKGKGKAKGKDVDDKGDDAKFADIGKRIMGEIKANGKTLQIKSVDDAIQLIQMGANYHKKMAGLKPALKNLKLLENHGLLDETKLNYLIDLHNKKPEAITQLIKDSKIDPMAIDLTGEETYVPENRTVSDKEVLMDEVLSGIEGTKSYGQTLTLIGKTWDDDSRNAIALNPGVIGTINGHMESGVFEQVAREVAYARSLGNLVGVSDFDAYQQIGSRMHKNKEFSATADQSVEGQDRQKINQAQDDKAKDDKRKAQKKAAGSSRQKPAPKKGKDNYNPLEMSDEDYMKLNKMTSI